MDTIELKEPWGESVAQEQETLRDKLTSLVQYINSKEFYTLSPNSQKLLSNQKFLIEAYIKTLNTRLYEDIDSAFVSDLSAFAMLMGSFNSFIPSKFEAPNDNKLSELLAEDALKDKE